MESISNLKSFEGTAAVDTILTFSWRPRQITITNNSTTEELKFKFNSSEDWATLTPLETFQPSVKSLTVYLNGSDTYRVWGEG